jgi:hypothetical protein
MSFYYHECIFLSDFLKFTLIIITMKLVVNEELEIIYFNLKKGIKLDYNSI